MEIRTHNPDDGVYATGGDWVHAVEVREPQRIVYLSGTMGLAADSTPGADLAAQLELVWSNIRRILAAADLTVDDIVRVTSYLRDPAYAAENAAARVKALGGRAVATTAIVAQTLAEDWLVEIEVIAAA
ncbi:RidA family protein [Pseudonocardia sp. CA-107938]|uniref:RidA family protein n=1 Tax=Pseudonocardia sp. CA-107938 TaxID=3240021 RepID=UPI003D8FD9F6